MPIIFTSSITSINGSSITLDSCFISSLDSLSFEALKLFDNDDDVDGFEADNNDVIDEKNDNKDDVYILSAFASVVDAIKSIKKI